MSLCVGFHLAPIFFFLRQTIKQLRILNAEFFARSFLRTCLLDAAETNRASLSWKHTGRSVDALVRPEDPNQRGVLIEQVSPGPRRQPSTAVDSPQKSLKRLRHDIYSVPRSLGVQTAVSESAGDSEAIVEVQIRRVLVPLVDVGLEVLEDLQVGIDPPEIRVLRTTPVSSQESIENPLRDRAKGFVGGLRLRSFHGHFHTSRVRPSGPVYFQYREFLGGLRLNR